MTNIISIFLNIVLILTICFRVPQEKLEVMGKEKKIKTQNSFLNSVNLVISFIIFISFGILIFLNIK